MATDTNKSEKSTHELYVHRPSEPRVELVTVEITETVAVALGVGDDEAVWLEDTEIEVDVTMTIADAQLPHRGHVHVNRCRQVETAVTYNNESKQRRFHPSTRVQRVFDWAVSNKGFNLTPVDAAEHELKVAGSGVTPDPTDHIGSFVGEHCAVAFNLVAKIRHAG